MGSATAQLPGLQQCSIEREEGRVSFNDSKGKGVKKNNVRGRRKGLVTLQGDGHLREEDISSGITNGNEERCRCVGIGERTNESSIATHG
jgi:hypothetical protein